MSIEDGGGWELLFYEIANTIKLTSSLCLYLKQASSSLSSSSSSCFVFFEWVWRRM